jgi:hypothetical protein
MPAVGDITEIFNAPHSVPGCPNKYLGNYNKLLSGLFEESPFLVTFPKQNCMEVVIYSRRIRDPKSVLLLLMLDEEPSWDESVAAEDTMKTLLMEADGLEIQTIHGLCVSGTRSALYRYDREQGVVTLDWGHVHFDLDLRGEDGASGVLEVAEDVKRMCRGLVGKLKY